MNLAMYDALCEALMEQAKSVEDAKRPGYTTGTDDVLSNFKRVGEQTGIMPEKVLMIYMLKHLDSIRTLLNNIEKGETTQDPEPWQGRMHDIINYVKLLYALMAERELHNGPTPTNGGSKHE